MEGNPLGNEAVALRKAPFAGADTRRIGIPWQRQNRLQV
jgi:hypothetical protein